MPFFKDADGDGFGDSLQGVLACGAPPSSEGFAWVSKGGDCNDTNPKVFPGQGQYFDKPYPTSGGSTSFDYDCDGQELGPNSAATEPDCTVFPLFEACAGKVGYKPSGSGVGNHYCGSTTLIRCVFKFGCQSEEDTADAAYPCR